MGHTYMTFDPVKLKISMMHIQSPCMNLCIVYMHTHTFLWNTCICATAVFFGYLKPQTEFPQL